ncbi:MAG: sporulation protein [bacterium]|nr:MAG: sporulation protein [bacterium]
MVIEELVKTVLSELKEIVKTETVVGEPIKVAGVTIVPVSKISVGFGAGGGKGRSKEGTGEATGGGASIEPVAFFVVRGEKVELITVQKEEVGWGKMIDLVPQIIDKVKGMKEKSNQKDSKERKRK